MLKYILKHKKNPKFNFLGTSEEIWRHARKLGYKGKTMNLDGFPVPDGGDVFIEEIESKKPGGVRLRNKTWFRLDRLITGKGKFKSQSSTIELGIQLIDDSLKWGEVYATTPEGIQKYDSMLEIMCMKPYFDAIGFNPIISFKKEDLPSANVG